MDLVTVHIYSPHGKHFSLKTTPKTQVHQIMSKIHSRVEDQMKTPRLFYEGEELFMNENLEMHGVESGSEVIMITDVEFLHVIRVETRTERFEVKLGSPNYDPTL